MTNESESISAVAPGFPGFYDHYYGYFQDPDVDWEKHDEHPHMPYKEFTEEIGRMYCEEIMMWVKDSHSTTPPITSIDFVEISSPKWYNFANDKVMMNVNVTSKKEFGGWLAEYSSAHKDEWAEYLKSLFTSRDGFHSWFSNDPEKWKSMSDNYQNIKGIDDSLRPSTYVPMQALVGFWLWMEHEMFSIHTGGTRHNKDWWRSMQGGFEMMVSEYSPLYN